MGQGVGAFIQYWLTGDITTKQQSVDITNPETNSLWTNHINEKKKKRLFISEIIYIFVSICLFLALIDISC